MIISDGVLVAAAAVSVLVISDGVLVHADAVIVLVRKEICGFDDLGSRETGTLLPYLPRFPALCNSHESDETPRTIEGPVVVVVVVGSAAIEEILAQIVPWWRSGQFQEKMVNSRPKVNHYRSGLHVRIRRWGWLGNG